MKKIIFSLILGMVMIAGMGNLAKGQNNCCPAFVIINNTHCPMHDVKLVTLPDMGNPSLAHCDTGTINALGFWGLYTGTYSFTPTAPSMTGISPTPNEIPALTPDIFHCNDGVTCVTEIEWTYLGITHDIDLVNGGQYGDVTDCDGNSKSISEAPVSAFIGYMSCPTCPGGNGKVYYDGPYGTYNYNMYCGGYSSFDPSIFTPSFTCTSPPTYPYVQVFRIDQ